MSFRCEQCGLAQPDKTKPIQVVTKRRPDKSIVEQKAMCAACAAASGAGIVAKPPDQIGSLGDNPALAALRQELPPEPTP